MKKLLIFFDNLTFKLNSLVINCIKRWIIYKIINNYSNYNEMCLYKTYPNFVEKKIILNNDNVKENKEKNMEKNMRKWKKYERKFIMFKLTG